MSFALLVIYLTLSFIRLEELYPALVPYRIMMCLIVSCAFAVMVRLFMGRMPTFRSPLIYLTMALLLVAMISLVLTGYLGGVISVLVHLGVSVGYFFFVAFIVTTPRHLRIIAILLVLVSLVMVGQGVAALYFSVKPGVYLYGYNMTADGLDVTNASEEELAERFAIGEKSNYRIRSLGFLNDPNDLAQTLVLVLPFLAMAWRRGRFLRNLFLVLLPGAWIIFGVFLTRSRGGLISLVVLTLLACRERLGTIRAGFIAGVLALLLIVLNFSGGRGAVDESSESRIEAWTSGILMLRQNPVFGIGFARYMDEEHGRTAHNSFVLCFSELGLVGYFVWMALLVVAFLELSVLANLEPDTPMNLALQRWGQCVRLAMSAFLVAAFFLSRTYMPTLFILLGLAAALGDMGRRQGIHVDAVPMQRWARLAMALQAGSIIFVYAITKLG